MVSFKLSLVKFMTLLAMSGTATAALSAGCVEDTNSFDLIRYNQLVSEAIGVAATEEVCTESNEGKTTTCDFRAVIDPIKNECENVVGGEALFFTTEVTCDDSNKAVLKAFPACLGKRCTEADKKEFVDELSKVNDWNAILETTNCKTKNTVCESVATCDVKSDDVKSDDVKSDDVKSGATASFGGIAVMMTATASLAFLAAI